MAPSIRPNRSGYHSRVVVPSELRGILGRRELTKSLRTGSYSDAVIRSRVWEGRIGKLFAYVREYHHRMTPKQIEALVQHYVSTTLEASEEDRASRDVDDDERDSIIMALGDMLEDTHFELIKNDYQRVSKTADELLATYRYAVPRDSPDYRRLCRRLLQGHQAILRTEVDRWNGRYEWAGQAVPGPVGDGGSAPLAQSKIFSEALAEYFQHYAHRDPRTNQEKQVGFNRFMEIVGGDRPLQEIVKADCIRFRDTYAKFPRRVPNKYRGAPIADMLKAVGRSKYVPVTKTTVNYALDDLRHFFGWAIKHDHYMGKNPVDGIAFEGTKQESYEVFTDDDLRRIFTSPDFLAEKHGRFPERYWLILSLLLSGARREEIAQLLVSDIRADGDIHYFSIMPDEVRGTTVKNESSKRRVPIHSSLIALGFLDHVASVRKRHGDRSMIFPLRKRIKGRPTVGDACGKWFDRHKEKVGVTGKKPLHSFRHTFVTRLTGLGVPQDRIMVIVGHTDPTMTGGVYTDRSALPLKLLSEAVELLRFDWLKTLADI